MLHTEGLQKSYGGLQATRGLSFEVEERCITALIGPNGAGKTTAFNLISGFERPDAGRVTFRGKDITGWTPHRIATAGLARSFQEVRIFERMTALENVMVARPHQSGENPFLALAVPQRLRRDERLNREQAVEMLDFVGLADKRQALAEELSYGQQKLVSIARMLAVGPSLMLLDEPASGLDPIIREHMVKLMKRLVEDGKSILLIEHNMEIVREVADKVVFLAEGATVASGTAEEVLADRDLARLYFGL
ncbi:MAG: ABC transporter ATP-binding protein [Parvibaculum sp.]